MLIDAKNFRIDKFPAFIVIDGVNGAGKSTLQSNILGFLQQKKIPAIGTREPGATNLGKKLREIVLGTSHERPTHLSELFIFAADRAEHVAKVIKPNLANGTTVVSDRYYYSTLAFQGYGRKLDLITVNTINKTAISNTIPDLAIFLDLDPMVGIRRNSSAAASGKRAEDDAFEHERVDFQTRMREGFITAAKEVPEPCLIINATKPPLEVFFEVKEILERSL